MKLSQFGQQLGSDAGIVDLMEDLGHALNVDPDLLFLGGGNPAQIPEFETIVADQLAAIIEQPERLHKLIGTYQSPRGSEDFIDGFVEYVNETLGWGIHKGQVMLTNGSQSAFFILLNMLTGKPADEVSEAPVARVVFPMMPEYLGYADQFISPDAMRGVMPKLERIGEHRFKYHIDFDSLSLSARDAAVCVSRPSNPTGNVISSEELSRLTECAHDLSIPVIIDCAYGHPFPGIFYADDDMPYDARNIYVMSCSKLGLPGARTGIVVGPEAIIDKMVKVNTVASLANGNLGPAIVQSLMQRDMLSNVCREVLLPFYRRKRDLAIASVDRALAGLPYRMHVSEGAFFVWLWIEGLPISSSALYQRMKKKGVLIMDGAHFFFGVDEHPADAMLARHRKECIRLTFCQSDDVIIKAIDILGDELRSLF